MQVDKGHTDVHVQCTREKGRKLPFIHVHPSILFSSIPTRQAFLLQIEVQVSTSAYLLSKVNSSGFSIGYITEVAHGNPRFRFKLCDLNKVLG